MPGLAIKVTLTPLADEARIALGSPAVDVGFVAVLAVIAALARDTFVAHGVAGVKGAIGVLRAPIAVGAQGAGERVHAWDAARDVRPARDLSCPEGAASVSGNARPDGVAWRLA
jgi:hypothetical protein